MRYVGCDGAQGTFGAKHTGSVMNLKGYYDTIMDLSHGMVVALDGDGVILNASHRLTDTLGADGEALRGRLWSEVCFSGNEVRPAQSSVRACKRNNRVERIEGHLQSASGREHFIEWNLKQLHDSQGNLSVIICVGRDVTEHMELQKKLLQERMTLTESNKKLTCLYGISQVVSDVERELPDILQEAVDLVPSAFQFPEHMGVRLDLSEFACRAGAVADSEHRISMPVMVHGKTRGKLTVFYDGAFTMEPGDGEDGDASTFFDADIELVRTVCKQFSFIIAKKEALTKQETLERQLRHADRLAKIGQLASGVAHELNEPLANILGFAQLAGKDPDLPPQVEKDIQSIIKASLHAREVIRKLMYFSRQVPPQMKPTDMNAVVCDVMAFTESSARRGNVKVELRLDEELPLVSADVQHMRQVLVNLTANAIQAMPDGGTLTIETRSREGDVYLIVEDTGEGMSPETLAQIFNPFYTTKDIDEGTGLGLCVVHGIMHAHGGVIEAQSEPGRGSRFEVVLPCLQHDAAGALEPAHPQQLDSHVK